MKKLPSVGSYVLVTFLDHVEDGDEPMRCRVVGLLKSKGLMKADESGKKRRFLRVECWTNLDDPDGNPENFKTFTILQSTIEDIKQLVEV